MPQRPLRPVGGLPAASPASDVDAYIAACPQAVQPVLTELRRALRAVAPQAEERISYRMPALFQHGVVVYDAAFKRHIGVYPPVAAVADEALRAELARWTGPKGNLQFPLGQPMPYALIQRVAQARLRDNLARAQAGKAKAAGSGAGAGGTPRGRTGTAGV